MLSPHSQSILHGTPQTASGLPGASFVVNNASISPAHVLGGAVDLNDSSPGDFMSMASAGSPNLRSGQLFDPENDEDEDLPSYHIRQHLLKLCGHSTSGGVALGRASSKLRDLKVEEQLMAEVRRCAFQRGGWKQTAKEGSIHFASLAARHEEDARLLANAAIGISAKIIQREQTAALRAGNSASSLTRSKSTVFANATQEGARLLLAGAAGGGTTHPHHSQQHLQHQHLQHQHDNVSGIPHPSNRVASQRQPQSAVARKLRGAIPSRSVDDFVGTPSYLRHGHDHGGPTGAGRSSDTRDADVEMLRSYCAQQQQQQHAPAHLQPPPLHARVGHSGAAAAAHDVIDPIGTAKDALAFLFGSRQQTHKADAINAARSGLVNTRRRLLGGGGGGGGDVSEGDDDDDERWAGQQPAAPCAAGVRATPSFVVAARQRPQSAQASRRVAHRAGSGGVRAAGTSTADSHAYL